MKCIWLDVIVSNHLIYKSTDNNTEIWWMEGGQLLETTWIIFFLKFFMHVLSLICTIDNIICFIISVLSSEAVKNIATSDSF